MRCAFVVVLPFHDWHHDVILMFDVEFFCFLFVNSKKSFLSFPVAFMIRQLFGVVNGWC